MILFYCDKCKKDLDYDSRYNIKDGLCSICREKLKEKEYKKQKRKYYIKNYNTNKKEMRKEILDTFGEDVLNFDVIDENNRLKNRWYRKNIKEMIKHELDL